MKHLTTCYVTASPIGKKQIIGSIFPEKLIFSENQLRTAEPHVLLKLITRSRADIDLLKQGKVGDISDLSLFVPSSGAFSNQMVLIISKLRIDAWKAVIE